MSYSAWSDGSTAVAENQSAKAATSQKASKIKDQTLEDTVTDSPLAQAP